MENTPRMKLFFATSLCALCLYSSPALSQDVFSVPVVDKSTAGAPFEVTGKATLQELARPSGLEWSWGEKVAVKNTSGKTILLFVVTITEVGRHSAHVGRRGALGNGPTYQLEDDRFFSERLIESGARFVLRDTSPGTPDQACCIDPLAEAHEPSAEYRLEFAQFADGSVFGDPAKAQGSLAFRQVILRGLRELLDSYERRGETGFVQALGNLRSAPTDPNLPPRQEDQPPFFSTAICRQVLASYDSAGAGAALDETTKILKIAETHEAMIALPPQS